MSNPNSRVMAIQATAGADAGITPYQTLLAARAPYKTLAPVNTLIDQDRFKDKDREVIGQYWDETFTRNNTSEEIYDAIACKGGSHDVVAKETAIRNQASLITALYLNYLHV